MIATIEIACDLDNEKFQVVSECSHSRRGAGGDLYTCEELARLNYACELPDFYTLSIIGHCIFRMEEASGARDRREEREGFSSISIA
jgi:hypothetical protein